MISIIGLILVTNLVFAQTSATVVSVTPTQSAVVGQRAFHVKVDDSVPRFQPSRLNARVGDFISFQTQDGTCELRSSRYPCGSSEPVIVETRENFLVRDEQPQVFYCDSLDMDQCLPDMVFILNMPRLPSQPSHESVRTRTSSAIPSSFNVGSSSIADSSQHSTSAYPASPSQDTGSSRTALPILTAPDPTSGTATAITTPSPEGSSFKSTATTTLITFINLACVLVALLYAQVIM
jgi:hypothetical protein